ncbi:hypothetical protein ACWDV4_21380 [Micromonospora sp. NPDC003197]
MPPPDGLTEDQLKVATDALRKDAKEWIRWSHTLYTASQTAASLTLRDGEMCVLSEMIGLPDLYAAVQQQAAELALAGARSFVDVSDALLLAARYYDESDQNASQRLTPR